MDDLDSERRGKLKRRTAPMTDPFVIIEAAATSATALFIFLEWRSIERRNSDKVTVTRSVEGGTPYVTIRSKGGAVENCEVSFDGEALVMKNPPNYRKILLPSGGAEDFVFWAARMPSQHDDREVKVTERGKRIFKRKFNELDTYP